MIDYHKKLLIIYLEDCLLNYEGDYRRNSHPQLHQPL